MKIISSDTVVRWAVHPADQGQIDYVDGVFDPTDTLPHEGDVITRPFLRDPHSQQPVPVRVVQIVEMLQHTPPTLAVVVTRADRSH